MELIDIAKIAHVVNSVYCRAIGEQVISWENGKESSIKQVQFALDNPNATPENQHESWMKERLNAGWVLGPEKDVDKKVSPWLVPYADLPASQKAKDYLFQAVVHSLKPFISVAMRTPTPRPPVREVSE